MKRVELGEVRVCRKCGRGRAVLLAGDGGTITIPLDAARARMLGATPADGEVPWLSTIVVDLLTQGGRTLHEVVLDLDGSALRALVGYRRDGAVDVVACTPQEGLDVATRAGVPLYVTDEALAHATGTPAPSRETLH